MQKGGGAQVTADRSARSKAVILAIALAVVLLDQATKAWAIAVLGGGRRIPIIGATFDLRLVRNPGSAFGLFKGSTFVIFVASTLITVAVIVWAAREPYPSPWLGLIVGGGFGNLIDRVFRPPGGGRGEVIDFIYLSFWPTFNVADAAIVVGVGAMLILAMRPNEVVTP
jgi:signal peptidase II